MRARSVACGARRAAGLALCLELFGCSTPALLTRAEIAGEFTSPPEPFGKRCTAHKDAKQARTLVSCDAGEVLVMLPGLGWIVGYPHNDAIFMAYYRQPNSEGDDSPTTPNDALARDLNISVFVADPQFNAFDAPQFLRERYERYSSVEGFFFQLSKPEPLLDAEPPVLAFTVIGNPDGSYHHSAMVATVRRRADGRFVVYEVTRSHEVDVWGGPQPRYLLERIRDLPKSFWVFDRDGKQLPQ